MGEPEALPSATQLLRLGPGRRRLSPPTPQRSGGLRQRRISRAGDTFPEMHQSRSQLMFSKEPYRRCLRAFFPNLFGKGHARAYTQAGKSVAQNAVTMKIDFLAII